MDIGKDITIKVNSEVYNEIVCRDYNDKFRWNKSLNKVRLVAQDINNIWPQLFMGVKQGTDVHR